MITVTYSTRWGNLTREFDTLRKAERYAGGLIREMRRVGVQITSLTVDGKTVI